MPSFSLVDKQFLALQDNDHLKLIQDESLREKIIFYYSDPGTELMFKLLEERSIDFHDLVVDCIPLEAHIPILKRDSVVFQEWVDVHPTIHHEILECLQETPELDFYLKNTIRTYLLAMRELYLKAELNKELRKEMSDLLTQ